MLPIPFQFIEVEPIHEEMLRKKEEQDRTLPERHLYRFHHMNMWTKLRPGIWNFLEKVCCVRFLGLKGFVVVVVVVVSVFALLLIFYL